MRAKGMGGVVFCLIGFLSLAVGCSSEKGPSIGLEDNNKEAVSGRLMPGKGKGGMVVENGSKVKVLYTGKFTDGEVFDKSEDDNPLEFVVGQGAVIAGFEDAVQGMRLYEEKEVTIAAQDAYGQRNESLVRQFPKDSFPEDFTPQKGMVVGLGDPSGRSIPATIVDVADDSVTMDLNHPLAGKDLIFNIKIVSIE